MLSKLRVLNAAVMCTLKIIHPKALGTSKTLDLIGNKLKFLSLLYPLDIILLS